MSEINQGYCLAAMDQIRALEHGFDRLQTPNDDSFDTLRDIALDLISVYEQIDTLRNMEKSYD